MSGELWAVHGGGFYHNQKFLTGPRGEPLTENLHWFKWEAYSTWFSGMLMLAIVYWAGASTFLIDKSVLDLTPPAAIAISIATLVAGWFVYDVLCRVFEKQPALLWTAVGAFLLFADWGLFHVFGGRAAYIHVGAIIGTIMVANVAHVIIPGQRRMLAQIRAGQQPDPRPGQLGKTRSVHNTYLTLPVLFIMISNHYPMTYGAPERLARARMHQRGRRAGAAVLRDLAQAALRRRLAGRRGAAAGRCRVRVRAARALPRASSTCVEVSAQYADVALIVAKRCAVCHAARPTQPGFAAPPAGVLLDTPANVRANAQRVYAQAVASHAMPLGNLTHMTDAERAKLGAWIRAGAQI